MEDVAPILLQKIQADFQKQYENDNEVKALLGKLKEGTARHTEAYAYAGKVGGILADSYAGNLSGEVLPEGKMWYNIGNRVITPTLEENYKYISDYVSEVQAQLNQAAGIGIKPIVPPENKDRAKGIIDRLSSEDDFDKVAWILKEPIKTIARSIVDDSIKANAQFHGKSGLTPKIIRKSSGKCCKWCNEVAGVYYYPDVPDDVYRRHENCDCVVEYDPGNGKRQNVHTKQWQSADERERIEARKLIGIDKAIRGKDVTKQYISNATPNKGNIIFKDGYTKEMHIDEVNTAKLLHSILGGDIVLLPESNVSNIKTADYIWNGKYWDLKSTSTAKSANSAIRHGLQQIRENPGGVILNYNDNKIVLEDVIDVIEKRMQWSNLEQVDIMILANNKIEKILRYK